MLKLARPQKTPAPLTHGRFRSDTQGHCEDAAAYAQPDRSPADWRKEAARLASIQAERRRQGVEIARLAAAEAERQRAAKLAEGRAAEER